MRRQIVACAILSILGPALLQAAVPSDRLQIEHTALASYRSGESLAVAARAPGARTMRIRFRFPGVTEFQVRKMDGSDSGAFSFALDSREVTGTSFEYYLEAERKDEAAFLPAGAPSKVFTVRSEGGAPPEVPSDLPAPTSSAGKVTWPVSLNGSAQAVLYEKDEASTPKDLPVAGNVRLAAEYRKGDTTVVFDSNFNYSNTPVAGEKNVDLSNMAVSVSRGGHALKAGDVNVTESEFTVQGLGRRGLDYSYSGAKGSVRIFDINSQQPRGFDGFGIPKAALNIFGGAVGYKFLKDAVSVKAVYLTGKDDPTQGANVSEAYFNARGRKGSVFALVEETTLFQNKLTIGGEFARSDFDGDLSDGAGSRSDNAWRVGGTFRSGILQAGAVYRFIGGGFSPIGFQYFANDRRGLEANIGVSKGSFSLTGAFQSMKDNVEGEAERDTTKNMNGNLSLMWTASSKLSFNLGYTRGEQDTSRDGGSPLFPQDSVTDQLTGAVMVTLSPSVSLNLQLANASASSKSAPQGNNTGVNVNLGGAFRAGTVLSVSPTLGFATARNKFTGERQTSYNSFLAAEITVVPEWFTTSLQGGYTRADNGSFGVTETVNLSGLLSVQLKKLIKIGTVALSIRGNYGRTKMPGFANTLSAILAQCDFAF
jgi:hypothetical protein